MRWALLEAVSEEQGRAILASARRRRFKRGEVIFHEGDPGDTLHLIDRGHVAVRVATPLGDTATLRILGVGDYFGELAVISPAPRNATVVALESTETLVLHRDQFATLRRQHPGLDRVLLEAVVGEVRRLSAQLLDALYVPVPKRVVRRLVELADAYAGEVPPIVLPLTQEDLAGVSGTTRPTLNKVINDLQDQGLVEISRGKLTVRDLDRLRRMAR